MNTLETHQLRIAMLPLTDAAPLVVAQMQGFFAEEELDVDLVILQSWAQVRDAIQLEEVEAAQLLPLMPLAASLGLDGIKTPIITALTLNRNGNAISLSSPLYQRAITALPEAEHDHSQRGKALAKVVRQRQQEGLPRLRLAHVHPFSSHHYLLRAWLSDAGIDPDNDVELRVVPPSLMADYMTEGMIDGFCVGAPWSDAAAGQQVSHLFVRCEELWPNAQEKLLGVRQAWMETHPHTHQALLRAIIKAGRWLDSNAEHRLAASHMLAEGHYFDLDVESIKPELYERFRHRSADDNVGIEFYQHSAQHPSKAQLLWYAAQLKRWGHYTDEAQLRETIDRIIRADIHSQVNAPIEGKDTTTETLNDGANYSDHATFEVAGQRFDPSAPFADPT
ncbi:Bicarbonate transport ATP-binding protein CmpC [Halomonadaceae bacterium LMG 33818]|uniref:CmpA/NrtA family ABC transporter substrate-binding protein n=1 Tax=Cernens ardua TaxID=3402176 RepID=UPI003EDC7975